MRTIIFPSPPWALSTPSNHRGSVPPDKAPARRLTANIWLCSSAPGSTDLSSVGGSLERWIKNDDCAKLAVAAVGADSRHITGHIRLAIDQDASDVVMQIKTIYLNDVVIGEASRSRQGYRTR